MTSICYERQHHIIHRQAEAENALLAEFSFGDYSLMHPLVKLDPYLICPLTAMILFKTPIATEATITVLGKSAAGNISHTFPATTAHILPIYGLYADHKNIVEIRLSTGQTQTVTIQTEPLPENVPAASSMQTTAEYLGDNLIFLTAASDAMPVGYDHNGDIRWYANVNFVFDLKRMPNGHI